MSVNGPALALNGGSLAYIFAHSDQIGVLIAAIVPLGYLFLEFIKVISGELLKWRRPHASSNSRTTRKAPEKKGDY